MSNCAEYMELISAYVDGELTDADKQKLEGHLSACENCSALLDMYREASGVIADSCVAAPESLLTIVMDEVLREDRARAAIKTKRRRTARIVLTRYVPIAACLALAILVLPRLFGPNRTSSNQMSDSLTSLSETSVQMNMAFDVSEASGRDTAGADSGGNSTTTGSSSSTASSPAPGGVAPEVAPPPVITQDESGKTGEAGITPAPTTEEAGSGTVDFVDVDGADDSAEDDSLDMGASGLTEPVGDAGDGNYGAANAGGLGDMTGGRGYEDEPGETPGTPEAAEQEPADEAPDEAWGAVTAGIPELPFSVPEFSGSLDDLLSEYERSSSILFTSSIYAIIEISGGLDEMAAAYGFDSVGDVSRYFEIPRDIAEFIIMFIRNYEGVKVTIVDESGEFAVLMYTPGG